MCSLVVRPTRSSSTTEQIKTMDNQPFSEAVAPILQNQSAREGQKPAEMALQGLCEAF